MLTMAKRTTPAKAKPPNPWPAKLRKLRKGPPKLSQAEAGAKVGVSAEAWASWELGRRKPSGAAKLLLPIVFPQLSD